MRKLAIAGAVLVTALFVLRRLGPQLGGRAMRKCEEMFDRMPDEFPPKRMMRGIDEVRGQNVEILRLLGRDPASPDRDRRTDLAAVD